MADMSTRKTRKKVLVTGEVSFAFPETPYAALRKTRKNYKGKIDHLTAYLSGFYFLNFNIPIYSVQVNLKRGFLFGRKLGKAEIGRARMFLDYNEVMTPTIRF